MSKYTIGEAPMGIFPDGFNESVIITNQGPSTLYVDENSSITPQSFPIPALGTIVWDSKRPLWFLSDRDSSVDVTRNSNLLVSNVAVHNILYVSPIQNVMGGIFFTPRIEVAAFNTLKIMIEEPSAVSWAATEFMNYFITWYDQYGNIIFSELREGWRGDNTPNGSVLTLPVRGHTVDISYNGNSSFTRKYRLRVMGSTRTERDAHDAFNGYISDTMGPGTFEVKYAYTAYNDWTFATYALNGLGNRLTITCSLTNNATANGDIRILTRLGAVVGRLFIPNGTLASAVLKDTFIVPTSTALYVVGFAPASAAPCAVSFAFDDYLTQ